MCKFKVKYNTNPKSYNYFCYSWLILFSLKILFLDSILYMLLLLGLKNFELESFLVLTVELII